MSLGPHWKLTTLLIFVPRVCWKWLYLWLHPCELQAIFPKKGGFIMAETSGRRYICGLHECILKRGHPTLSVRLVFVIRTFLICSRCILSIQSLHRSNYAWAEATAHFSTFTYVWAQLQQQQIRWCMKTSFYITASGPYHWHCTIIHIIIVYR